MTVERSHAGEVSGVQPGRVRRIITGHDEQGRSVFLSDGDAANVFRSSTVRGLGSAVAWASDPGELSNDGNDDLAAADVSIAMYPPPGGTIFRIADFPPDHEYLESDAAQMFSEIGGRDAQVVQDIDGVAKKHFWFHQTDSVDYAIVVEGEVWLILDEGECLVRAGDVIVQRGTSHSWSNRSGVNCRVAFVLIGVPPIAQHTAPGRQAAEVRPA